MSGGRFRAFRRVRRANPGCAALALVGEAIRPQAVLVGAGRVGVHGDLAALPKGEAARVPGLLFPLRIQHGLGKFPDGVVHSGRPRCYEAAILAEGQLTGCFAAARLPQILSLFHCRYGLPAGTRDGECDGLACLVIGRTAETGMRKLLQRTQRANAMRQAVPTLVVAGHKDGRLLQMAQRLNLRFG